MHKRIVLLLLFAAIAVPAVAYETPVHRVITQRAWLDAAVYLEGYMGIKWNVPIGTPAKLPAEWIAYGSVREDDILPLDVYPAARPVNHFLDPQNGGAGLTVAPPLCLNTTMVNGIPVPIEPADEWALAYPGFNTWSLYEVREHQYKALTALTPEERASAGANMLRGLGQLVHLVEDMAQPEHTRNDQHLAALGAAAPSLYEQWTLEHLITHPRPDANTFFYGYVYPPVTLPHFRDYFRSADRKGMADFASRNFVTQDTNYSDYGVDRCFTYGSPSILSAAARIEYVGVPVQQPFGPPQIQNVLETVYTSHPYDAYVNRYETDDYHTTHSIFDAETKKYDPSRSVYSLNDQSYYSRALKLLPRAVSYAAGFMKKFFGEQIVVTWVPQTMAADLYTVYIENRGPRTISRNAEITLAYRPGPAYFGRTDTQDSWVVLRGHLYDFGVGDIPQYTRGEIRNVYPVLIHPGDVVQEFERVAVLRENRATPDETITSWVDPAGKSFTLEFDISWPRDIPIHLRPTLVVTQWQGPLNSQGHYALISDGGHSNLDIATSTLTYTSTGWNIKIQSTTPTWSYTFHLQTPQQVTVQVRALKNGVQVLNQTRTIPQYQTWLGVALWEVPGEYP